MIRALNEVIKLDPVRLKAAKVMAELGESLAQHEGHIVDVQEKAQAIKILGQACQIPGDRYAPYDFKCGGTYFDIKLVNSSCVYLSHAEYLFINLVDSYCFLIYGRGPDDSYMFEGTMPVKDCEFTRGGGGTRTAYCKATGRNEYGWWVPRSAAKLEEQLESDPTNTSQ